MKPLGLFCRRGAKRTHLALGAASAGAEDKAPPAKLGVPLRISKMPLNVPPPHTARFGSPLVLSRVHWVRPEPVCEVRFPTWTADGLLKRVV